MPDAKTVSNLIDAWVLDHVPSGLPYLAFTDDLAQSIEELQAASITELEAQLKEARELARIGGWQPGTMGRGAEAVLPGWGS